MYDDFSETIEKLEFNLRCNEITYTALGTEIDDLIDDNREVFASTIGGLDEDVHAIIASYYDFKKQRDKAYQSVLNIKGQLEAINQFVALRRKSTSDKNKEMTHHGRESI